MTDHSRAVRDIQPAPSSTPAAMSTRQLGPGWVKALLAVMAAFVLVVSGVGYATVGKLGNDLASATNLNLADGRNQDAPDGATDILLIGSDSRTDAQGRPLPEEELRRLNAGEVGGEENTDTIMVIRVPNDGARATAVSIPRDTYVHDRVHGNMKINGVFHAHKQARMDELVAEAEANGDTLSESDRTKLEAQATEAGRQGLLAAIADLTGVDIDHYAEVGLHGFVSLTNAVGGVDVCLNQPVNDEFSGANFPAGEQTLGGYEALAFVRQRHGLPQGDIDRVIRQQAYMASLVNKVLSTDTLTSPQKMTDMVNAVESSVIIDEDWDILSFANQLANLAGGNVVFTTIPLTSIDGTGDYGESIVTVDRDEVHAFMDDLLGPEEQEHEPDPAEDSVAPLVPPELEGVNIQVLNASGFEGLAGSVGVWLEEQGLPVDAVSNAQPGIYFTSQIVAADPASPEAIALAELLGGLPITGNDTLTDTLIVVTAEDYAGPQASVSADDVGEPDIVGTPGADFGHIEDTPEIDAGGDGPRCVN